MDMVTPMSILRKKIQQQIRRKKKENEALLNLIKALDGRSYISGTRDHFPEPKTSNNRKSNETRI